MSKPRPDAKLLNLPEEAQAQIAELLLSGMPYHAVLPVIKEQFGVQTSMGALSNFWQTVCEPALLARRRRAVSTADEVAAEAAATPGRFDAATIDSLKQRAFELSIQPQANPRDVKQIFALVLKARDQDLQQQSLKLDVQKFQFDAAAAVLKNADLVRQIAGSSATEAEKTEKLGQAIFGEEWAT